MKIIFTSDLFDCSYLFSGNKLDVWSDANCSKWGHHDPADGTGLFRLSDLNKLSVDLVRRPTRSLAPIGTHINHSTYTYNGEKGVVTTRTQRGRRLVAVDNRYHRRPGIRISSTVSRISSWYRFPAPPTKSGRQKESRRQTHLEPHLAARANGSA